MPRCRHRRGVRGIFIPSLVSGAACAPFILAYSVVAFRGMANLAVKDGADSVGELSPSVEHGSRRHSAQPWQILCGLVVSGFLLALPGGLLPLWGFHIQTDFGTAGNFFLLLGLGVIGGGMLAQRLDRDTSLERLLAGGYFAAAL